MLKFTFIILFIAPIVLVAQSGTKNPSEVKSLKVVESEKEQFEAIDESDTELEIIENQELEDDGVLEVMNTDEPPSYPGGKKAEYDFVTSVVRWPQEALDNDTQGNVYLEFIINKDGTLSDIKVLKGIGFGCDEEAVSVIKKMPKWNPGIKHGEPVDVIYRTIIEFKKM